MAVWNTTDSSRRRHDMGRIITPRQQHIRLRLRHDQHYSRHQYAPLSFYMYNDTLGGFDYDLMRIIERMQHIKFTFQPINTAAEGIAGLRTGRFRLVAADLPMTSELTDSVLFTQPAYLDRQILVQLTDSAGSAPHITSVLDLRGDTVYLPASSAMRTRIANLSAELGDTVYYRELPLSPAQLFVATALGEIPQSVINEQTAKALSAYYPKVNISTGISFTQFQPWMVRRNDTAMQQRIDRWLTAAKSTPEYKALLQRYLDIPDSVQ